jgi:hypothetical protein
MSSIRAETEEFRVSVIRKGRLARARAALQLVCGIDLEEALASPPAVRRQMQGIVRRRLERERLKGHARHWSYDLNRHIAIKLALDAITGKDASTSTDAGA